LSGVDIRITKIAENTPKRPAPARKDIYNGKGFEQKTHFCIWFSRPKKPL
jgi:hypothetical protein